MINVSGEVIVEILVDEKGNVEEAKILSGPPLLQAEALKAANSTKFKPFSLGGIPVKARGILTYEFKP
jgi:protein TonB